MVQPHQVRYQVRMVLQPIGWIYNTRRDRSRSDAAEDRPRRVPTSTGQNDAHITGCLKLSPDETERGNRSVGPEIDPRYTTSYSTSVDTIGLSRAVWPKANYFRSGRIRNCTL